MRSALDLRLHAAWTVATRELRLALTGVGAYVAAAIALLAAGWIVSHDVRAIRATDLLVLEHPFQSSATVIVLLLSLFLGVSTVVSVARERDRGTLEVLFYGPIDEPSYLVGKLVGQLGGYFAILPMVLAGLLLLSFLTGFELTGAVVAGLVLSVFAIAQAVAVALLLSVVGGRLRSGVLLFVGITIVLVAIGLGNQFLAAMPIASAASPLLPLRDGLAALQGIVAWISPYAALERTIDSITLGAWGTAVLVCGLALLYAAAAMLAAAILLRRRGVRALGE